MTEARADLIIFDCDGVLVDSEPLACRVLATALAEAGYPIKTAEVIQRFAGVSWKDLKLSVETELGRPLPHTFEKRCEEALEKVFRQKLRPISSSLDTFDRMNVKYCVASSSTPARLALALGVADLWDRFVPHIFSSSMVRRGKPEPDIFLYAAEKMQTRPERCMVVEDSVAGVCAARIAGMHVIGFCGGSHCTIDQESRLTAAGAERTIFEMRELPDIVENSTVDRKLIYVSGH